MTGEIKTRAIVLKALPYGESDLIITFMSETSGQIRGIAKGARASRRRFAGCFEPFTLIDLVCRVKESGGLARVDSADAVTAHYGIREDLARLTAGARILELAAEAEVHGSEAALAFSLLDKTLELLERSRGADALCAAFYVKYLALSGFWEHGILNNVSPGTLAFLKRAEEIEPDMMGRLRLARGGADEVFGLLRRHIAGIIGKRLKTLDKLSEIA